MAEPLAAPGPRTLRTARNVTWLAAAEIFGKLATLLVIVAAARLLSRADFGTFSFAWSIGLLVAVIPAMGLDVVLISVGSREPASLPTLLATVLTVRAAVCVPAVVVGASIFGLAAPATPATLVGGLLLVAAPIVDTLGNAFRAVATALERQRASALALLLQRLVTALLAGSLLWTGAGVLATGAALVGGSVAGLAVLAVAAGRLGVRPHWTAVSWSRIRQHLNAAWAPGVHGLVSMALFRVDMVLLGLLAGQLAVGLYAAAYRLLETVLFVAWVVVRAVLPVLATDGADWVIVRGVTRALTVMTWVFAPYAVVLWLYGGDLLQLLYGPRYASAHPMLLWLAPAPLLFGAGYLLGYTLVAVGQSRRILAASGAALAVNVGLNLVLIPAWAGVGAAAATTGSYAAELLLLLWLAGRYVDARGVVRALLAPLLAAALAAALAVAAAALPVSYGLAAALGATTYLVAWFALARVFDPEQIRVVRALLSPGGPAAS